MYSALEAESESQELLKVLVRESEAAGALNTTVMVWETAALYWLLEVAVTVKLYSVLYKKPILALWKAFRVRFLLSMLVKLWQVVKTVMIEGHVQLNIKLALLSSGSYEEAALRISFCSMKLTALALMLCLLLFCA